MIPDLPWMSRKQWAYQRFGRPLYRIPVDPGWGCPHKPRHHIGGCTFCADDGARARQITGAKTPRDQVRQGLGFTRERYGEGVLELYLQAYTSTHTSTERLRHLVEPLLAEADFVSLSLGTRPDCLPPAMIRLLQEWNQDREIWVEPGVQTANDRTLQRINRQHLWAESRDAMLRLVDAGIQVCPHLLFGLPGESADDAFDTLEKVTALPVSALKLHNLHVLEGSELGEQWKRQPFPVLRESQWLELVMQLLRRIPPDLPLFRLFTDSSSDRRMAPESEFPKGRFLRELEMRMTARNWKQGDRYPGPVTQAGSLRSRDVDVVMMGKGRNIKWNPFSRLPPFAALPSIELKDDISDYRL